MDDERERLLQAKELVSQKRFAEARSILITMPNNPTAQKWLDQLDRASSSAPSAAPTPPPYTPAPPAYEGSPIQQSAQPQVRRRPALSDDQVEQARAQMQATLSKAGISLNTAALVLAIAAVGGLLAALIDVIIGLPTGSLVFRFGWFGIALAGITYPLLVNKIDLGGLGVAAAAGLVFSLFWFLLFGLLDTTYMNILDAIIAGIFVGMAGFGWYAAVPFLRERLKPFMPNLER